MVNTDHTKLKATAAAKSRSTTKLKVKKASASSSTSHSKCYRVEFPPPPPPPPPHENNISMLRFLFEKKLKLSDVSNSRRIIIPKKFAERYFPRVVNKAGFYVFMDDLAAHKVWTFRYRYWINKGSRQYVLECTNEYIKTYGLDAGHYIVFYKDLQIGRFAVSSRKDEYSERIACLANHQRNNTTLRQLLPAPSNHQHNPPPTNHQNVLPSNEHHNGINNFVNSQMANLQLSMVNYDPFADLSDDRNFAQFDGKFYEFLNEIMS